MTLKPSTHQDLVKTGLPRKGVSGGDKNQITSDLNSAREAKDKIVDKVKQTLSPVAKQNSANINNFTLPVKEMFSGSLIKKIVRIAAIVILLLVLLYIVSLVVSEIRQNGEVAIPGTSTPTVAPYLPYNPSVYAEDKLVLQLEEDIKVLDRELSTVQLKESILTPPNLDFDVNFKE